MCRNRDHRTPKVDGTPRGDQVLTLGESLQKRGQGLKVKRVSEVYLEKMGRIGALENFKTERSAGRAP